MKALVTGASGHLGANLIRSLKEKEWTVQALVHHDTRAVSGLDVSIVQGDILDPDSLKKACTGIDTVFHLAARISVVRHDRELVAAMNVTGVRNIVDACLQTGVRRLVHTSSFHSCVQEPLDKIFTEERPLVSGKGFAPYNLSKADGERIVMAAVDRGLDAVIVVPSGIIGPYDYRPSHFGATILNLARKKLRILVDAGLDWVDARDVAGGMIEAAARGATGEKFLLSGHRASLKRIAELVADYMEHRPPRVCLPLAVARAFAPVSLAWNGLLGNRQLFTPVSIEELNSNRCLNHDKATRILGYTPRPLEDTIRDTMEWFDTNGYLTGTEVPCNE